MKYIEIKRFTIGGSKLKDKRDLGFGNIRHELHELTRIN